MPPKSSRRTATSVPKSALARFHRAPAVGQAWTRPRARESLIHETAACRRRGVGHLASITRESSPACPTWNSWQCRFPTRTGANHRRQVRRRAVADYHELLGRIDAVSIAVPTCSTRVAGPFSPGIPLSSKNPGSTLTEAELLVSLSHSTAPCSRWPHRALQPRFRLAADGDSPQVHHGRAPLHLHVSLD